MSTTGKVPKGCLRRAELMERLSTSEAKPTAVQILQRAVPHLDDANDRLTIRTDRYGLRIAEMKVELAELEERQEKVAAEELEEILEDWTVQEVGAAYAKHYFTEPKGKKA